MHIFGCVIALAQQNVNPISAAVNTNSERRRPFDNALGRESNAMSNVDKSPNVHLLLFGKTFPKANYHTQRAKEEKSLFKVG